MKLPAIPLHNNTMNAGIDVFGTSLNAQTIPPAPQAVNITTVIKTQC